MVIQLRDIFEIPGETRDFEFDITPEETSYLKQLTFSKPIHIKGPVRNKSGIVMLKYEADFVLDHECDRCLVPFEREYHYEFEHNLVHSLANEDDIAYDTYIVAEKDHIDLNDTVLSDILPALPSKFLCREDCKGLCFICGCNLNEEECDCQK